MSIWQIWKRELRGIFLLDTRRILFLFLTGIVYLFLFGFLYEPGVVKHVPAVILDENQTHLSRELVTCLEDSESFDFVAEVSTVEDMRRLIENKEAYAAIQIPADFAKKIVSGRSTSVLCMINGANIVIANTVSTAFQTVVNDFSDEIAARCGALKLNLDENFLKKKIAPIQCNLRVMNNPTQSYLPFFSIGLAMAAFHQGLLFAMAASIYYDFSHPSEIAGTSISKLLFGKFILYWTFAVAAFGGFLLSAEYFWSIPVRGNLLELFSLGGAFSFAMLLLTMTFAPLCESELQFVKFSIVYIVPAFIFSGYTFPLESMPPVMQAAAKILFPMTWTINALRDLMLSGFHDGLEKNLAILCFMGIICIPIAAKSFQKKFYVKH